MNAPMVQGCVMEDLDIDTVADSMILTIAQNGAL